MSQFGGSVYFSSVLDTVHVSVHVENYSVEMDSTERHWSTVDSFGINESLSPPEWLAEVLVGLAESL